MNNVSRKRPAQTVRVLCNRAGRSRVDYSCILFDVGCSLRYRSPHRAGRYGWGAWKHGRHSASRLKLRRHDAMHESAVTFGMIDPSFHVRAVGLSLTV
jgi:hypothetical protein